MNESQAKQASEWLCTAMMLIEEAFNGEIPDDQVILDEETAATAAHQFVQAANSLVQHGIHDPPPAWAQEVVSKYWTDVAIEEAQRKGDGNE